MNNYCFGRNFIGEKNYYVMDMNMYKEVATQILEYIGVLVPVPSEKINTMNLIILRN